MNPVYIFNIYFYFNIALSVVPTIYYVSISHYIANSHSSDKSLTCRIYSCTINEKNIQRIFRLFFLFGIHVHLFVLVTTVNHVVQGTTVREIHKPPKQAIETLRM